jgi:hypothetical protein
LERKRGENSCGPQREREEGKSEKRSSYEGFRGRETEGLIHFWLIHLCEIWLKKNNCHLDGFAFSKCEIEACPAFPFSAFDSMA